VKLSKLTPVEDKKEDVHKKYSEPCRYWSYIHPETLKNLQTGREGSQLGLLIPLSHF